MRKLIEEYGQVIIAVLAILALIFIIGPLGSLIGSGVEGNVNSMVNGITGDIPDGGGGGPSYTYDVIATSESGKQLDHYTVTYGVGSSNLIRPKTIDGYITPQSQMIPWDSETKTINFKYDMVDYALSVDLNGGTCTDQSTIPSTYTVEDAPITLPSDVKRGDEVFMGYSGSGLTTLSKNVTIPTGSTGNRTYIANFKKAEYVNISFDSRGGSKVEAQRIIKGGSLESLPTPTRLGYDFVGWYDGYDKVEITKTFDKDVQLVAKWKAKHLSRTVIYQSSVSNKELKRSTIEYDFGQQVTINGINITGYKKTSDYVFNADMNVEDIIIRCVPEVYTITYNLNGGAFDKNVTSTTSYTIEAQDISIPDAMREGHTFTGWTDNKGAVKVKNYIIKSGTTGNITLTANYDINTYRLSFNANGGSCNEQYQDLKYGTLLTNLPTPTRSGYTFIGWFDAKDGGKQYTARNKMPAGDMTLYAHWRGNILTINYHLNGGTDVPSDNSFTSAEVARTEKYTYPNTLNSYGLNNASIDRVNPPTGYSDCGYYNTQVDGKGKELNADTAYELTDIDANILLHDTTVDIYAQWKPNSYTYNIVYESTSGKQLGTATLSGLYGDSKQVTAPEKKGYIKPAAQVIKWDSVTAKTVKFIYTPIQYAIEYELNGGNGMNVKNYTIETPTFSLKEPTKVGHTFSGWIGSNGSSAQKDVIINTGSYGNKTYTANWKANTYTLTYKANGGNGADVVDSIAYDSNFTVRANMFIKTGYRFIGWNTDPNGNGEYWTTKIGTTAKWDKANNVILYAIWKKNTFNFDINAKVDGDAADINGKVLFDLKIGDKTLKGISDYQDVAVVYGTEYEISNIRAQEGYIYNGITSDSKPLKGTVTGSNIVYLDFTTKSITIKLHRNTSTSDSEVVSKTFKYNGSDQTLPTVTWSKIDYSLTGWAASSTAINAEFAPTATVQNSYIDAKYNEQGTPVDLYAVWKLERYTVTFDAQGGQLPVGHPESKQYAVGQPMGVLPVPTKNGREFVGWYTQPNGAGQKVNEKSTFLVPNTTIYARWVSYELTNGMNVNSKLKEVDAINKIKSIEFVDTEMPTTGVTEIKGLGNTNESIIKGWYTVDTADSMAKVYISSQKTGQKVIANADCLNMFNGYISYNNYVLDKVKIINVGSLDTSNVLSMNKMFYYVGYNSQSFNVDLSQWNVSNVTTMSNMFASAGRNATTWNIGNLSQWNVSNVTTMSNMFYYAGDKATTWNIGDLSQWNVGNVTNMSYMFSGTGDKATTWNIGDLSQWNVSNVTNMCCMFSSAGYNATTFNIGDLSQWNVSNVTNMRSMFPFAGYNAITFNIGDLSKWDVSSVTDMGQMFSSAGYKATTFNIGDLSQWNVGNVTNMINMFYYAGYNTTTFNIGDLSKWNVSKVTNMSSMFYLAGYKATTFNIGDLSQWNVGNVTNMSNMFRNAGKNATPFTLNLSGWDVSNVTNMQGMFNGVGANKILTPKNISSSVELKHSSYPNNTSYWITERTWYNLTENGKEYPAGTFPVGNGNVSHTLVDEKPKTIELVKGSAINMKLHEIDQINKIKSIEFTDITMPSSGVTIIPGIDADGDGGVVGWYTIDPSNSLTKVYISTQKSGQKVIANENCDSMFSGLKNVETLVLDKLDVSNTIKMSRIFYQTGYNVKEQFEIRGLNNWNSPKILDFNRMFYYTAYNASEVIIDTTGWKLKSNTKGYPLSHKSIFEYFGANDKTGFTLNLQYWDFTHASDLESVFWGTGANEIKTPYNIPSDAILGADDSGGITSTYWYDVNDGTIYPTAQFPRGNKTSRTLVRYKF